MAGWENAIAGIKERAGLYHGVCILLCLMLFYMGVTGDVMPVKKLGKSLGTPAAVLGGLCFAYYLLRELFVRGRKRGWKLPAQVDSGWKSTLKVLRLLHPLLGIFMAYLVWLHGSLLLWAGVSLRSSRMVSGLAEGLLALFLLLSGSWLLRQKALRRWHRWVGCLAIVLFLVHVYVKIKF